MEILDLLRLMKKKGASDLFVTAGAPPSLKVDGQILPVKTDALSPQMSKDLAFALMNEEQQAKFEIDRDANFGVTPEGMGRFRVNVFHQQGEVGMVIRAISSKIPTFTELHLPENSFEQLAMARREIGRAHV